MVYNINIGSSGQDREINSNWSRDKGIYGSI